MKEVKVKVKVKKVDRNATVVHTGSDGSDILMSLQIDVQKDM